MEQSPPVSVVIPNYNGTPLLRRFLPSVIKAVELYGRGSEIIVSDDASIDGSVIVLKNEFPQVRVLINSRNLGFSPTVNAGFAAARHPVVVLLNNDAGVSPDFIAPLVGHFADNEVFAVCARSLDWDGVTFRDGGKPATFRRGFWRVTANYDLDGYDGSSGLPSFYASGAFSAFDRAKYDDLGGLDPHFAPFNWEDTDLGYRALKRGWKVLYEPRSVAFHRPNTTIAAGFRRLHVKTVSKRNRFLFIWKNIDIPSPGFASHVVFALISVLTGLIKLDLSPLAGLCLAVAKLKHVMTFRAGERKKIAVSDRQIAAQFRSLIDSGKVHIV